MQIQVDSRISVSEDVVPVGVSKRGVCTCVSSVTPGSCSRSHSYIDGIGPQAQQLPLSVITWAFHSLLLQTFLYIHTSSHTCSHIMLMQCLLCPGHRHNIEKHGLSVETLCSCWSHWTVIGLMKQEVIRNKYRMSLSHFFPFFLSFFWVFYLSVSSSSDSRS